MQKKNQILGFLLTTSINNYLIRFLNIIINGFVFAILITFLFVKYFNAAVISLSCASILLITQTLFLKLKTHKFIKLVNKANEVLITILLLIISIENSINSTELIASYAVIIAIAFRLTPTISRIQVNIAGMQNAKPQVKELIRCYEDLGLDKMYEPVLRPIVSFKNMIELKNVSFSYSDKNVLNNINLEIKKGEFIGIVGPSGVGKTTLVDVLTGLYKINSGEILIDGKFVTDNKMPRLNIGYIPQDFTVITASIRENVAFSSDEIDDQRVVEVLKQAQLYDFIKDNFEEGIYANPFVDSRGFSQGQKQRISIARALYSNPDIIVLDEATSSLDLKTENEFCEILKQLKGEKTIIAIAHRLSTLKSADRIVFMKNNEICDVGTMAELSSRNSEFESLIRLNNANCI